MTWYVVRINKETRRQDATSAAQGGCFSALFYVSAFIRDTNLDTHELYARYVQGYYSESMCEFLSSEENPLPIKAGTHFFTNGAGLHIRLDGLPYRECMLTKFLLCNLNTSRTSRDAYSLITGRPAQMPEGMCKIVMAMAPFNFVYENGKVVNCSVSYITRCYDSWVRLKSNTANMNLLYSMLVGSDKLKNELSSGIQSEKSICDFAMSGSSWKETPYSLNKMFNTKTARLGLVDIDSREKGSQDPSLYIGKQSNLFTMYVSSAEKKVQVANATIFAKGFYQWAEKMYVKKSKRPGYWYDRYINSKIPNIAAFTDEDFQ